MLGAGPFLSFRLSPPGGQEGNDKSDEDRQRDQDFAHLGCCILPGMDATNMTEIVFSQRVGVSRSKLLEQQAPDRALSLRSLVSYHVSLGGVFAR